MKTIFEIASVFLLLDFVAFAQIPSDANLRIGVNSLSETNFSGAVSNTEPDISYEIQRKQGRTDWVSVGVVLGSETTNWTPFNFKISGDINPKTALRVRSWKDSQGVGMPDWWQLKYFGNVGIDPYGNPAGDGWNNMQKFQNGMDPFEWYVPPKPVINAKFYESTNDARHGTAILTWQIWNGTIPDYFLVERADRTLRPMTNDSRFMRPGPNGFNRRSITNQSPNFQPMNNRPGWQREDPWVTGPFKVVARINGQPSLRDYRYVESNVDTFFTPVYGVEAHFTPPLHARLDQVNAAAIRETILPVAAHPTTNGYVLTVSHPIPYARYLLLVRDKNNPQWRASGYFVSGTNRNPVYLHVDKKGMMSDGQSPIALPEVKFLPDVVKPVFTAGWGEDSDGDGLPDIYEVLVTHTGPDNADTGDTGILDGYKKMTDDGLSNLEKFHLRVDPLQPAHPPATVELIQPTGREIMNALMPKTDLSCELQIEVRTNGATSYQPIENLPWVLPRIMNFRQMNEHKNFDLRISWQFAESKANQYGSGPFEQGQASFQAIELLARKISVQLVETFRATLATNPPLSRSDTSNRMAAIYYAERQNEIDRGVAWGELMALQDNQAQDFYGKLIDQSGQPVTGADITVEINLAIGRGGTQKTQTDAAGLFQFTGLRGKSLNITPEKKGYLLSGHGLGLKGLNGPETGLNNRAVYSVWKLRGAEPVIKTDFPVGRGQVTQLHHDGTPIEVDLLKGTQVSAGSGQLKLEFWRDISNKNARTFDWKLQLSAPHGGLAETSEEFAFQAPESGYQPSIMIDMPATNQNWQSEVRSKYYIQLPDGKYGRIDFYLLPHNGVFTVHSVINPSGSRNLEPAQ